MPAVGPVVGGNAWGMRKVVRRESDLDDVELVLLEERGGRVRVAPPVVDSGGCWEDEWSWGLPVLLRIG